LAVTTLLGVCYRAPPQTRGGRELGPPWGLFRREDRVLPRREKATNVVSTL